jgi:hypothetical protein
VLFILGFTTQKTKDWATRTTLKSNDKQHKILHRKLKIGQQEPHYKTKDKQHKILHRKQKIGKHEPHKKPMINNTKYNKENKR